jgi:hypothetical protein
MKRKLLIGMLPLVGMCAASMAAVIIVDYSGTGYVTADRNLAGVDSYNASTAISPDASLYTGQSFYGAVVTSDATAAPVTQWRIFNNLTIGDLSRDWIGVNNTATTTGADKHHYGFILFKQADFSNYSNVAGGVSLTSDTPLSLRARRTGGNPTDMAFVIQTDAGYFISSKVVLTNNQANGFDLVTLNNPTSTTWSTFDPATSIAVTGATATPDLDNVIGVGFWFDNVRAGTSTNFMGMYVSDVSISAVPEPSTYAAILGLMAFCGVMWRRRSR